MPQPANRINETERQESLHSYSILDTLPEADYDNITAIASTICGTPISLVSFVDEKRQWFKSHHGLPVTETLRKYSFCAHAIQHPNQVLMVGDAREDVRFRDNPFVTGAPYVIFYAGIPLISSDGFPLGTLCVIDHVPRTLTEEQVVALTALSRQVTQLLELRKTRHTLQKANASLEEKNAALEKFAFLAAHDIKSPLHNISRMAALTMQQYSGKIDGEGFEMLRLIADAAGNLTVLIDGLLEYSRCDNLLQQKRVVLATAELFGEIHALFANSPGTEIRTNANCSELLVNRAAIEQVLINLVANAVKYNDKDRAVIEIGILKTDKAYQIFVKDNGPGIAPENHEKIFEIFEVLTGKDRFGNAGHGIGLATVKKLVEKLGGTIRVESTPGTGANFICTLPL